MRGRLPCRRRIDDEHRTPLATELRGDEQRAHPDIVRPRQRWNVNEGEIVNALEREQTCAARSRADHVIVAERMAIVAVRIGVHVSDRQVRARHQSTVRALLRHGTLDANERRFEQDLRDVARRLRIDGYASKRLLLFDALRAGRAHALNDEIETILVVRGDVVVVDGCAQKLARSGRDRFQRERLVRTTKRERSRRSTIDDANDDRAPAALLEEMLDCVGKRARLPQAAEDLLVVREAVDRHRPIDRSAQRAADECRRLRARARNRLFRVRRFSKLDTVERTLRHLTSPSSF